MTRSAKGWIGAATAAVLVAVALPANTSAEGSDIIYACFKAPNGQVRFVSEPSQCLPSETVIPLNQTGVNFFRVNAGEQHDVEIAGLGSVRVACSAFGIGGNEYSMWIQALTSGVTSVWIDDSIAGSSFHLIPDIGGEILYLDSDTGTRHVVVRAMNSTKSGTWDIFIEGSVAHGCRASFQYTP